MLVFAMQKFENFDFKSGKVDVFFISFYNSGNIFNAYLISTHYFSAARKS